jgi:hypothetical protein
MNLFKAGFELIRDAVPPAGAVAATGATGAMFAAPGWLIALGQAAIVIGGTILAIDRRNREIIARVDKVNDRVALVSGELHALRGRVKGLRCQDALAEDCDDAA